MEPVTLILTALVTGAAKAAGDAAPDLYKGLKALIQKKFAGKPAAEVVLAEHEKDPETYEAPLKKKLVEAGVDQDEAIIAAARKLMEAEDPAGGKAGKYNTTIGRDFKGVQGDISGGTINQTFTN